MSRQETAALMVGLQTASETAETVAALGRHVQRLQERVGAQGRVPHFAMPVWRPSLDAALPWLEVLRVAMAEATSVVSAAEIERSLAGEPAWNAEQRSLLNTLHDNCRDEEQVRSRKARAGPLSGYPWLALEERLFGNPTKRFHRSRAHGLGCSASYLDGIGIDVIAYAGLKHSDELHDALWGERNWQAVVSDCPSSEYFEVGEHEGAPGMSDVRFWVSVLDPREFARELRTLLVDSLAQYRARGVGA